MPCKHLHQPVQIGEYTVTAIGSRYLTGPKREYMPEGRGIYLDYSSWKSELEHPWSPSCILVKWPDFGTISLDAFTPLLTQVINHLRNGVPVEIGCIGAHGRTGTFLAGLIILLERLPVGEAIRSLRTRYCANAIETPAQELLLYALAGEEAPATLSTKARTKGRRNGSMPTDIFPPTPKGKVLSLSTIMERLELLETTVAEQGELIERLVTVLQDDLGIDLK